MSPISESQNVEEDVWRCMCPLDHSTRVVQCGRCGDDQAKAMRAMCDDESCDYCGWTCEFPQSHFEYGRSSCCAYIREQYTVHVDDENEEFIYTHHITGEVHRVEF
jgi:hypothetical protein